MTWLSFVRTRSRSSPMADVQPDRAMPVHRDILPALCLAKLSPSELKVALAVLRASWGWSETTTRHRLSQTMVARLTGITDRRQIRTAFTGLRLKGVLLLVGEYDPKACKPAEWAIVKDYESWEGGCADIPWRQAGGQTTPEGIEPPGSATSEPPGSNASEPPGANYPRQEAQDEAQLEAQGSLVSGDTQTTLVEIPKKKPKQTAAQRRRSEAVALIAEWYRLAGVEYDTTTATYTARVECALKHLPKFQNEWMTADLKALSEDDWWRGANDTGTDVFRVKGPTTFWGKQKAGIMQSRAVKYEALDRGDRGAEQESEHTDPPSERYPMWLENAVMIRIARERLQPADLTVEMLQLHPRIAEVSPEFQQRVLDDCAEQRGWKR